MLGILDHTDIITYLYMSRMRTRMCACGLRAEYVHTCEYM